MFKSEIIKDGHFEEVAEVKLDSKSRITLSRAKNVAQSKIYKVYRNKLGQIMLDPQVIIPASEAWIYKNPKVLAAIKQGIKDAKEGRLVKAREDYSKYLK